LRRISNFERDVMGDSSNLPKGFGEKDFPQGVRAKREGE
jgi:hypothetical protein